VKCRNVKVAYCWVVKRQFNEKNAGHWWQYYLNYLKNNCVGNYSRESRNVLGHSYNHRWREDCWVDFTEMQDWLDLWLQKKTSFNLKSNLQVFFANYESENDTRETMVLQWLVNGIPEWYRKLMRKRAVMMWKESHLFIA